MCIRMNFSNGRYNSYGEFLKEKFGHRIHKIPINAGFTCPNRDGTIATGGCSYCNIASFTPETARARIPIRQQVAGSVDYLRGRFKSGAFIAYFQPYTNTYAPLEHLQKIYEEALDHPEIIGISIGTRPDCIDEAKLAYFEELARDYFVTLEFGIESAHDRTLTEINRCHDFQCTIDAFKAAAGRGIYLCGHVIYGFPNENRQDMFETTEAVAKLPVDFIKLHNLHIVRQTDLAQQYMNKPFHLHTFDEWIDFVCAVIQKLNPKFIIERLYGDAPKELLIEPRWSVEKSAAEVIYAVQQKLAVLDAWQGKHFMQELEKTNG